MNDIINLLDLEDKNVIISSIDVIGTNKYITIERNPETHYCPSCGFIMHSCGLRTRTIRHPILQDTYHLIIKLKQRRWKCTNLSCGYCMNESFSFVSPRKRTTNATDLLIINALRDINATSAEVSRRFNVSDTYVFDVFERYVRMDRLKLSEAISVDEVYLDMDTNCKYVLVILDFISGDSIDLVKSRQDKDTLPYFLSIPREERDQVKYLISDMYNPYLDYVQKYFHNAIPVVDSFHVTKWILDKLDKFLRSLLKTYKEILRAREEKLSEERGCEIHLPVSDEIYLLENFKWIMLENQSNIRYSAKYHLDRHFNSLMNTYTYEAAFMKLDDNLWILRELKEKYISFNSRNYGNPERASIELDELIEVYRNCGFDMFNQFADLLSKYRHPILNSFILVERYTKEGKIMARLSNGPIESLNRKAKDLKRNCRGFTNFNHLRNRFLFATRKNPAINGRAH